MYCVCSTKEGKKKHIRNMRINIAPKLHKSRVKHYNLKKGHGVLLQHQAVTFLC